ncbi:MAG: hypothetical protein IKF38_01345 [Clostridia bacterium]|nr:hypothetical protein [Clostridia bacterium]
MTRTRRDPPTYDDTKHRPDKESNYRRRILYKTFVEDVTRLEYAESEYPNPKDKARKFRKKLKKDTHKNKEFHSLSELMIMEDFQPIIGSSKNINEFKENLSYFLQEHYSNYISIDLQGKRDKIYSLLELLRNENPTISSDNLAFLKSLINGKETENKESYSLAELMVMEDFQSIIGSSKNITEIKEKLSYFLQKHYSKYITFDPENKIERIYDLIILLKDENSTISSDDLVFLKSLVNEKETEKHAKKETDIQK